MRKLLPFLGLALFSSVMPTSASVIAESGAGGTPGTAQIILASAFTLPVPATVFNPPGFSTATINGRGSDLDVDFYRFDTFAPSLAYFDIDNVNTFDTFLALFNGAGTLLGYGDDSPLDPGSTLDLDSFLGVISLPAAGTYYVAVSPFGNFPSAISSCGPTLALTRPDGQYGGSTCPAATPGDASFDWNGDEGDQPYTLHLSIQTEIQVVPEPATIALLTLGLAGLGFSQRK